MSVLYQCRGKGRKALHKNKPALCFKDGFIHKFLIQFSGTYNEILTGHVLCPFYMIPGSATKSEKEFLRNTYSE